MHTVQGTRTGHVRGKLLGSGVYFGMNICGIEVISRVEGTLGRKFCGKEIKFGNFLYGRSYVVPYGLPASLLILKNMGKKQVFRR